MPSNLAHTIFGREVLEKIGDPDIQGIIEREPAAFFWGTQGPDPFFLPSAKRENYDSVHLACRMHDEKTAVFFENIGAYVQSLKGEVDCDLSLAYFFGYMCHYGLDKNVHNYVNAEDIRASKETPEQKNIHGRLEWAMDWLIYQCKHMPGESMKDVLKNCRVDAPLKESLEKLYSSVLSSTLDFSLPQGDFSDCLDHAAFCFSHNFPDEKSVDLADVLNLRHHPWEVPAIPGKIRTDSVFDLFDQGKTESIELIRRFYTAYSGGTPFSPGIAFNFSCRRI